MKIARIKSWLLVVIALIAILVPILPVYAQSSVDFPSMESLFGTDKQRDKENRDAETVGNGADAEGNEFRGGENAEELTDRRAVKLPDGNLITDILPRALNLLLYGLGIVLFIVLVYAGVLLLISQGDEEVLGKLKTIVLHAVIGGVIIGGAFALVVGMASVLGSL